MRALIAAVAFAVTGSAAAADMPVAPRIVWSVGFGGGDAAPGLALALDVAGDTLRAAPSVVELGLGPNGAGLQLAGLPLWRRNFSLGQAEDPGYQSTAQPKPWYARQWVLWTAGGLAATAALLGSLDGGSTEQHNMQITSSENSGPATVNGENGEYTVCVGGPDVCAPVDTNGGLRGRVTTSKALRPAGNDAWLDAGTGHMGDLYAR
jgi:hypothetical protein